MTHKPERKTVEILSWERAAVRAGFGAGRSAALRLRAMAKAQEQKKGVVIELRRGRKGGWGGTTMPLLRLHLPWIFRAGPRDHDALADRFAEHLASIDERVVEGASRVIEERVDPKIDELHGRDSVLERRIDAVERETAWLKRQAQNGTRPHKSDPA